MGKAESYNEEKETFCQLYGKGSELQQQNRETEKEPVCHEQLKTNTVLQMKDAGVEFKTI